MVPAASAGPRCRAPRLAGADEAQVLARASWAVRRLLGQGPAAEIDPRGFPGRTGVTAAQDPDPEADRPVGVELDALGEVPRAHHDQLGAAHAMTRAAWDLALWRRDGITPWDEVLEPVVAAARGGAGGLAPFLPVSGGHRLTAMRRRRVKPSPRRGCGCSTRRPRRGRWRR